MRAYGPDTGAHRLTVGKGARHRMRYQYRVEIRRVQSPPAKTAARVRARLCALREARDAGAR